MQLIEHYLSLQGEGLRTGKLTYFVRFARCNLRCSWCDSTYTFGKGKPISFEAIAQAIKKSKAHYVCLTGGEPLLHTKDCIELIRHFPNLHFDVETSGSIAIRPVQLKNSSIIMDWKLNHSKMSHKMKQENFSCLRKNQDLLKFVTDGSKEEQMEILKIEKKTRKFGFLISLQPVFGTNPEKCANWLISLKNPRFQFNLQLHKTIWSPTQTRV